MPFSKYYNYNESLLESVGVNVKLGIDLTGNIDNYRSAVEDFYNNLEDKINLLFDFKISNDLEKLYDEKVSESDPSSKYSQREGEVRS